MLNRIIKCAESEFELRNVQSSSKVYVEELYGAPVKIA